MKQEWRGYIRLGVVLFALYLAIHYWDTVSGLLRLALHAAIPLLLGGVIAYLVNILMSFYERCFFPAVRTGIVVKLRRSICMLLALASLVAILFLLVRMILPELAQSGKLLVQEAVPRIEALLLALNRHGDLAKLLSSYGLALVDGNIDWNAALTAAGKWLFAGLGGVMGSVVSLVSTVSSVLITVVVSLIFSIYILAGKETLCRQCNLLMKTYLSHRWYGRAVYFFQTLNDCFRRFVVGQCMEAVILGLLCMAGMTLFGFPYATMVGTLIGFTALIPVAGAYIGAGVGAFLIFTVSPIKAVFFLLFILVLQQLEGNLIYPKVVGTSIGLPGIWVLAAVMVGGGILGIAGMLLAVPLTAALYQMLKRDVQLRNPPVSEPDDHPSAE